MKEGTLVYGRVELYVNFAPAGEFRAYKGTIKRDFEDGSYLVDEEGTELLVETYFSDTLFIAHGSYQ